MKQAQNRRRTVAGLVVLGLLGLVPITAALTRTGAEAAASAPGDGSMSATAGASCWGIKQQHPDSADGSYWLLTASMDRPEQFHCDMTSDGGGWVLVARGREGWSFNPAGQRAAAAVRDTVDGPEAFAPAALGTETIDQLLDHANLAAAPDGIRLERSLNTSGSTRQDYRLYPTARGWTWNLAAGQLLDRVVIDGSTFRGSNTADTSAAVVGQKVNQLSGTNNQRRLVTTATADHNNVQGFSFGRLNGGSSAANNHLWTYAGEQTPIPFTRVWLRPQIANDAAGFTAIPTAGFPAETKPLALKNRSEVAPWGVVGVDHTNETMVTPWNNNVSILKVFGDRVYLGGRFTGVQQGPGSTPIPQPSLAAFDLEGNWISTFRPTFDGRVWDLTMTADGKLIVGGDFLSVDGTSGTSGLAALDPATGAVIPSWNGSVTRNGDRPIVRGLDSDGDYVYVTGRFNRATGGTATNIGVPNTVSLRINDAQPGRWRPVVHASAARVRASADGSRVYMGGFFNGVNNDTNHGFYAITNRTNGSPVPGIGAYQPSTGSRPNNWYQQAVAEVDDRILVGGAEHTLQMYDHDRTTLLNSHITKQGGDFQAIEVIDGEVYAACHCINWNYSGTNNWNAPSGYRAVDP
ncbi:MAG: fibrinogen-like YCDxxxxGGGW domain-containing protein, partial [Aquihabitans sp.]